jgi:putative transposase
MIPCLPKALMGVEADVVCGAPFAEHSSARTNARTTTGAGSGTRRSAALSWRSLKLHHGSDLPDWLLERRRRAAAAPMNVVATSYLLGMQAGGSDVVMASEAQR